MPSGWRETSVKELAVLEYGGALPEPQRSGTGFPVVGSAGVVGFHDSPLCDRDAVIVIGRKGTAGALHWIPGPCSPIDTTFWVRPLAADVDYGYLLLLLQYLDLPRYTAETGVPGLSRDRVYELQVSVPPLADQRRILDLVAAVDAVVNAAATERDAASHAYHAFAARELAVPGDRLALGEICDVAIGRQRNPMHASGPDQRPYLRSANVKDGALALDDVLTMSFGASELPAYQLADGDVMVTEGCGSPDQLGASAAWRGEIEGTVCFQNTLLRLRAVPGVSEPRFLLHLARFLQRSGGWVSVASGTNILHIGVARARQVAVPDLPMREQIRISDALDALEGVRQTAADVVLRARSLRRALLDVLVSGRQAVPPSYDRFVSMP